ncbi:RES domain-containing protein [Muricauda sp. 334s03]|uniref:RES domain-containing protein n=1 Tax=Flagellimonas yonaguniensis TaxID=3031325 RepID=A0ABT5Y0J3_9FLAO|nr:RES domain-containing protein [[Muricauda] yonaguniensis]MDF0716959.1 RES domain-containing protein [[Muricauda] yonaguniensis]
MIEKVANNKYNTEPLRLNPPHLILEKLNHFRALFGRIHNLSEQEFVNLTAEIKKFFNVKPVKLRNDIPERLVRISNNNRILAGQGKALSYLTDISQLLAPPIEFCKFGRCNLPEQQVLYCAVDMASAFWETKPQLGDVITISHYRKKEGAKANCSLIAHDKMENPDPSNHFKEVFYLLEEFFIDVYSLEVDWNRPRDYLFSSLLSSELLFYPVPSDKNIEAIIYPSVKRKKYGHNFALRNDLVFDKYDLIGVETRFMLEDYKEASPMSSDVPTDSVMASFGTEAFNMEKGKILYDPKVDEIFDFFREMQMSKGDQVRKSKQNMIFNLTKGNCTVTSHLSKRKKK